MARIESDAQPFDVVAEDHGGVGVFGHPADLGQQAQANALLGGQGGHRPQTLHLGVEGGAQLGRADRDRHDLDGLRQAAAGGELAVVIGLGGLDVDAQRHGRQAVRLAAERHGPLRVGQHGRGLQVPCRLVKHDLHGGVFKLHQLQQRGIQRQVGKAAARSGNKHMRLLSR